MLRTRLAEGLVTARAAAGLSLRDVGAAAELSTDTIRRVERGEIGAMSIDHLSRVAEALGQQLSAGLFPVGDPVRDRAHLALLERLRVRVGSAARWRAEVPIPIVGDLRSGDAMIGDRRWTVLVEAETHVGDVQLVERKASAKQRDLGADRLILLLSDTRHNRDVLRLHPELRERFPLDARTCLRRVARGEDPGGDAILVL